MAGIENRSEYPRKLKGYPVSNTVYSYVHVAAVIVRRLDIAHHVITNYSDSVRKIVPDSQGVLIDIATV